MSSLIEIGLLVLKKKIFFSMGSAKIFYEYLEKNPQLSKKHISLIIHRLIQ